MNSTPPLAFIWGFPFFFVGLWLAVTIILGFISGWYALATRFPDRDEPARLKLNGQSGLMGWGVSMSGILVLSACPSGLRIGIWKIFGPFSRPFFVPWAEIRAAPRQQFFQKMVRLGFGWPEGGVLSIDARAWARLVEEAGLAKGDPRVLPLETNGQLARSLILQWLIITCGAAAFYYFGSRQMGAKDENGPPLALCILFPAIVFGIGQIVRFGRLSRNRTKQLKASHD